MLLRNFYDKSLAQASYLIGCQETHEALVIDPARDITPYLDAARAEGLHITHVTETHIHADFVSGSRELAARTGARLYLSAMGGADWQYRFAATLLHDGDSWRVGNVLVEAIHTPGHTPEHLMFQITDTLNANLPIGLISGDCLFVGDVGRPDLLETAAGVAGTKELGARQQFANIQRLKTMPDYLQVWPGHGAGSACGKALGAVPSSTIGYEKLFNPAFQFDDETAFVRWLLDGQPEPPRYFAQMKRVNRDGPTLLADVPTPQPISLEQVMASGGLVIDGRSMKAFSRGHLPGVLGIPATDSFSTYAGWFINYEAPTVLIADDGKVERLIHDLRAIGVDNLPGHLSASDTTAFDQPLEVIDAPMLAVRLDEVYLLDVRGASEYNEVRIPGAHHIMLGYLPRHLDSLPRDRMIVAQCASGVRSQVAASLLQKQGFTHVSHLKGGIEAWERAGLPVEREGRPEPA